ncbi:MAG: carbonic anhydrase [Planctomycetota bacterium]
MPDRYVSTVEQSPTNIHAAAVYCSDGRIGEYVDDFMTNALDLPHYDRIAVPGGPAAFLPRTNGPLPHERLLDELKFLIDGHALHRLVLIQHDDCAFYRRRSNLTDFEALQIADVAELAGQLRDATGVQNIRGYFARFTDDGMVFERITP